MFKFTPILLSSFMLMSQTQASAELNQTKNNLILSSTDSKSKLIAAWNPVRDKRGSKTGASTKTLIALEKFKQMPELKPYFKHAKGFAVFPNIKKAGFGVGGSRGKGELFQDDKVIGSIIITQVSIGFQLGGQAFSQIIFFEGTKDIKRFTDGNFEFGASASAALINTGAAVETAYSDGIAVLTLAKGGLMYEASIGGQKFSFTKYE